MMFVAILGTTITPYVFFWQASQEAEENVAKGKIKEISQGNRLDCASMTQSDIRNQPKISKNEVRLMRSDTAVGMAISQIIMWAIITTTSGSLHTHNVTDIQTADQAVKALEPLVNLCYPVLSPPLHCLSIFLPFSSMLVDCLRSS